MITTNTILKEINRPMILAQASESNMLLRMIYYPEGKTYEVDCVKNGEIVKKYAYFGRIAYNAALKYNEAYKLEVMNVVNKR